MRLVELARLLPYYWWRKNYQSDTALEQIEGILSRVAEGGTLTDDDKLFLFGSDTQSPEAMVWGRLLAPVAYQMDLLDAAYDEVRRSRDLDWAWGWVLDLLAGNVGVKRVREFYSPGALDDIWLRELVRLFVYCHSIKGTRDELLTAVAWFIGVATRNAAWATQILPQITLIENKITTLQPQSEPLYMEFHMPWKVIILYANDHFYVADTDSEPTGSGFWVDDSVRGFDAGVWDGHNLLSDTIAFLRHIVPAGTRFTIYGTGFYIADTDSAPQGDGFWVDDGENGFDIGRWDGLMEDGALESLAPYEYEQLRIAPYSYAAVQKELIDYRIKYKDLEY